MLLGFGINQLARGGGDRQLTPAPRARVAPRTPTVTYEKVLILKIVPHLPVEQRTVETWSSSSDSLTERHVGRPVYVVKMSRNGFAATTLVDKKTYEPLYSVDVGTDLRMVYRTLAFKTLPATQANLALTSLAAEHPGSRTLLQASPHIRELYGQAAFLSGQHA